MGRVSVAAEVVMTVPTAASLAVGALLVTMVDWRWIFVTIGLVTLAGAAHIAWWLRDVIARPRGRKGRGAARGCPRQDSQSGTPA